MLPAESGRSGALGLGKTRIVRSAAAQSRHEALRAALYPMIPPSSRPLVVGDRVRVVASDEQLKSICIDHDVPRRALLDAESVEILSVHNGKRAIVTDPARPPANDLDGWSIPVEWLELVGASPEVSG